MLEKLMKLYVMAMTGDIRSPLPHLFGPPGCGKSSSVEELAKLLGVNLYVINVSRLSPLEIEGVQMPVPHDEEEGQLQLRMLTATFWTQLKDGDILLLDEFLRGFPEVYNGLLDILTSRRVGSFVLPKVFIVAASNSTVAYDKALEDRLLHIPVDDIRKRKRAKKDIAERLINSLGLLPVMADSAEMITLIEQEIAPMYAILDQLGSKGSTAPSVLKGRSLRNLIGQAQLREIQSDALRELLRMNNLHAINVAKHQFVVLPDGKNVDPKYTAAAQKLRGNPRLTPVQAMNLELNLQLIEMEQVRTTTINTESEDVFDDDEIFN